MQADIELGSTPPPPSSAPSSQETSRLKYGDGDCTVIVRDDIAPGSADRTSHDTSWYDIRGTSGHVDQPAQQRNDALTQLKNCLTHRDIKLSRWINVLGFSPKVMRQLSKLYLGDHGCLELDKEFEHSLGGPTSGEVGSDEFIWIQSHVWFANDPQPTMSKMKVIKFRLALRLPTPTEAAVLITNFIGPRDDVLHLSHICTSQLVEFHPVGRRIMNTLWIPTFAITKVLAEQLDFAFLEFNPWNKGPAARVLPQLDNIPRVMEHLGQLSRLDLYLSNLEEFISFLHLVYKHSKPQIPIEDQRDEALVDESSWIRQRSDLEVTMARNKISQQQKFCRSCIMQNESLIQTAVAYSNAQIVGRLDEGRVVAHQISKLGITFAGIAFILTPLGILTSFYGMNVSNFTNDGRITIFDTLKTIVPVSLATIVCFVLVVVWLLTSGR